MTCAEFDLVALFGRKTTRLIVILPQSTPASPSIKMPLRHGPISPHVISLCLVRLGVPLVRIWTPTSIYNMQQVGIAMERPAGVSSVRPRYEPSPRAELCTCDDGKDMSWFLEDRS